MRVDDVLKCSFQNWYNDFKDVTFRSIFIPLPDDFVSYLLSDGILLPESCSMAPANNSDDSDEESWLDSSEDAAPEAPLFPELDRLVEDSIVQLGGKVFPKLNWSSPRDANWILFNNSCCCTSKSDVYLLLQSSDFIVHDLTKMFALCEDFSGDPKDSCCGLKPEPETFYLVLRKWTEVDNSGEFRCFVKNNSLIGISQREHSLYFDHIFPHRNEIVEDINSFFIKHIKHKFLASSYVFDVYRRKKSKVSLVDFNPFSEVTESLLFDWEELATGLNLSEDNDFPEFRCIENNCGIQPKAFCHNAIPKDIIDLSSGEDSFKLVDLMKLKIEEQSHHDQDESSDDEKWTI